MVAMLIALVFGGIWLVLFFFENATFHEAAIGLMFSGLLAMNAIYDKVEGLYKVFNGKED